MKHLLTIFALYSMIIFGSCGRKWKEPSPVGYSSIIKSNQAGSLINVTSGQLMLEEFDVEGNRSQGQNFIQLEKKFETGWPLALAISGSATGVSFDIPQGTYSEIRIRLRIKEFSSSTSATLFGTYINLVGDTLPVIFEFRDNETIEMRAKTISGSNEIVLVADNNSSATIIIDPHYWFSTITQTMLESADTTLINSIPGIMITESDNSDIYDLIIDRIKNGNDVVFN